MLVTSRRIELNDTILKKSVDHFLSDVFVPFPYFFWKHNLSFGQSERGLTEIVALKFVCWITNASKESKFDHVKQSMQSNKIKD